MARMFSVFNRYPIIPSMMTYSVLYPSANIVQQHLFRTHKPGEQKKIDWKEVSRYLIYGGLCHAPLVYNWLKFAARMFPKNNMKHLLAKVAMDQTLFAPVGLTCFYVGLTALEGKTREEVYQEWSEKFWNTWATSVFIWPALQTINFKFVPAPHRAIFVACCSFFWTTMLAGWKFNSQTIPKPLDK